MGLVSTQPVFKNSIPRVIKCIKDELGRGGIYSISFKSAQHSLPEPIRDDKHPFHQREGSAMAFMLLIAKMTFPQKCHFSNMRHKKI